MLRPRWHKVLHDILQNKTRTSLVVLSVAIGVVAIGTIMGTQAILSRDMKESHQAINPQSGYVLTAAAVGDDVVAKVGQIYGVAEAEGRNDATVRFRPTEGQPRALNITVIGDFNNQRVNTVAKQTGAWPPATNEILIERASMKKLGVEVGDRIQVETPDRKVYELRVSGTTYDANLPPAGFTSTAYGYINMDTWEALGQVRGFKELDFVVADKGMNRKDIQQVAARIQDAVEATGATVTFTNAIAPGKHPADNILQPTMILLSTLGLLTLLLSGFLVTNTISAVLTEQVRQIGMMKAIGARRSQLMGMYMTMVLGYSLLSLAVGAPLGVLGSHWLSSFVGNLVNVDITRWTIPGSVLAVEVAVGLLVPLLVGVWPVWKGTAVTVREAMFDYGVGKAGAKKGVIDRLMERIQGMPRPFLLSLRNTFRRKARLLLTVITLALAGAIFMGVFGVRDSLKLALAQDLQVFGNDAEITFERPQELDAVYRLASDVPGVVKTEGWRYRGYGRLRPDGTVSPDYTVRAINPTTNFMRPILQEGRWLLLQDENAVVVDTNLIKEEGDIKVGDTITLRIGPGRSEWKVVGLVRGVLSNPAMYIPFERLATLTNTTGQAPSLFVLGSDHSPEGQTKLAQALEKKFEDAGIRVTRTQTLSSIQSSIQSQFNILIVVLLVMSVLVAFVGGLGLTGTMSINVLERTREIGVMRAIGAATHSVVMVVMAESLVVGLSTWVLGAVAAVPISMLLGAGVGKAFLGSALPFAFSISGAVIWFFTLLAIAALASVLPAWRAAQLSVREVLAYE